MKAKEQKIAGASGNNNDLKVIDKEGIYSSFFMTTFN